MEELSRPKSNGSRRLINDPQALIETHHRLVHVNEEEDESIPSSGSLSLTPSAGSNCLTDGNEVVSSSVPSCPAPISEASRLPESSSGVERSKNGAASTALWRNFLASPMGKFALAACLLLAFSALVWWQLVALRRDDVLNDKVVESFPAATYPLQNMGGKAASNAVGIEYTPTLDGWLAFITRLPDKQSRVWPGQNRQCPEVQAGQQGKLPGSFLRRTQTYWVVLLVTDHPAAEVLHQANLAGRLADLTPENEPEMRKDLIHILREGKIRLLGLALVRILPAVQPSLAPTKPRPLSAEEAARLAQQIAERKTQLSGLPGDPKTEPAITKVALELLDLVRRAHGESAELADAHQFLGNVYGARKLHRLGERELAAAIALRRRLLSVAPRNSLRQGLATDLLILSAVYTLNGQDAMAARVLDEATTELAKIRGPLQPFVLDLQWDILSRAESARTARQFRTRPIHSGNDPPAGAISEAARGRRDSDSREDEIGQRPCLHPESRKPAQGCSPCGRSRRLPHEGRRRSCLSGRRAPNPSVRAFRPGANQRRGCRRSVSCPGARRFAASAQAVPGQGP